jgi:hypothetical protein
MADPNAVDLAWHEAGRTMSNQIDEFLAVLSLGRLNG